MWELCKEVLSKLFFVTGTIVWAVIVAGIAFVGAGWLLGRGAEKERKRNEFLRAHPDYLRQQEDIDKAIGEFKKTNETHN